MDMRSPQEFAHGAFPGAVNFPLLDDSERARVGKAYRESGREAALALGHSLVSGEIRAERLSQWQAFVRQQPRAVLYCYRGGLRSRIAQQWLAESGVSLPRVSGGYKALRRYLINRLEQHSNDQRFMILGGRTGSGKTRLLDSLDTGIDLEGLANHRGSAFGPRVINQPGQIDFENRLAVGFLKLDLQPGDLVFLEDESRAIGSLSVPGELHERMRAAPLAVIEEPRQQRAAVILSDYIQCNFLEYRHHDPDNYWQAFEDYLLQSLGRIRRRLGDALFREVAADMHEALKTQQGQGEMDAHLQWIIKLLTHYYDPMYDYQLQKKLSRVVFRGNSQEFLRWAARLKVRPRSSD